jgi:hypothetical protein
LRVVFRGDDLNERVEPRRGIARTFERVDGDGPRHLRCNPRQERIQRPTTAACANRSSEFDACAIMAAHRISDRPQPEPQKLVQVPLRLPCGMTHSPRQ